MKALNAIRPFVTAHPFVAVLAAVSVIGTVAYTVAAVRYAAKNRGAP
jgi:hypothetical protein